MTTETTTGSEPGPGDGDDERWDELGRVLREATIDAGRADEDVDVEWALREARLLVLDGRATLATLVGLARRHAFGAWPTLRDCDTGTAELVLAVLRGWDRAGIPGTGHEGRRPNGYPSAPVEVAAIWCAAAAQRLGLDPEETFAWALVGLLDPFDAPDPGWVDDPDDGPDRDRAPGPEDDDTYRRLLRWRMLVGPHDAPVCHRAGLEPDDAAVVLAMPFRHPERRRLLGN